jgi:hypothetical protein
MANGRSGQVFLEDFDIGMATTMGGELIEIDQDGERVQVYAVNIAGVTGPDEYQGLVPISMSEPEDAFQEQILPQIIISRGSEIPQMNRWFPGGREYQVPASNAQEVIGPDGVTKMPNRVERKWWTLPFEINYDIHLRARQRAQADLMWRHVGRFFWAYGQVFLTDSEGDERGYYAFVDSNDPLGELTDVADRLQGRTISMRVEAELDFDEPHLMPTTPGYRVSTEPKI